MNTKIIGQSPQQDGPDGRVTPEVDAEARQGSGDPSPRTPPEAAPVEIGGRPGPDPTRFGDWEKNGRCIDF